MLIYKTQFQDDLGQLKFLKTNRYFLSHREFNYAYFLIMFCFVLIMTVFRETHTHIIILLFYFRKFPY
jgi:hypothetical protein